ncbi:MAG: 50S ribosomal protein L32, partial [Eubacteriales bacterium]|nr:50S ribosomal protein L32 [Eubacteriales bacterium]
GIVECPQCHQKKLAHRVCKHCGYYDGVQVIDMTEKKENA